MMEKCFGPFGPFMGMEETKESMKIQFLKSLAKPGDTPDQVKANSDLANAYVEVIMKDRKRSQILGKINDAEESIKINKDTRSSIEKDLIKSKESLAETEKVFIAMFGSLDVKPVSKEGLRLLNNLKADQAYLADCENQLKRNQAFLDDYLKKIDDLKKQLEEIG